jgi:hypothetical protein
LFKFLCYESLENTNAISAVVLELINLYDFGESEIVMKLFKSVLLIDDSLQNFRVKNRKLIFLDVDIFK